MMVLQDWMCFLQDWISEFSLDWTVGLGFLRIGFQTDGFFIGL